MNILFIGDVFGKAGRKVIKERLPELKRELKIDVCIMNCENVADGRGITEKTGRELFHIGVDVMTSGNHLWDRSDSFDYIHYEKRIVRPGNYPEEAVGSRFYIKELPSGMKLAVLCLTGQSFMQTPISPFIVLPQLIGEVQDITNKIFVDFHAESTAEKRALGLYFDGSVSAIIGTHTHIQTADEEILPCGTAYLSDAGMTGPHDSIIGIKKDIIFQKMTTGMPLRYEVAETGLQLNGVFVKLDDRTGRTVEINRIREKYSWQSY